MRRKTSFAAALLLAAALAGCGGGWTDADARAVDHAMKAQQALLALCEGDGGASCTPARVRAVERATTCNLGSALARHGAGPDPKDCLP